MKSSHSLLRGSTIGWKLARLLGCLGWLSVASILQAGDFQPNPAAGAGNVIVHGKFGGNIFGFEIDPNGTEGLLCEAVGNPDGTVLAAVETFSQSTGKIIRVVSQSQTDDDFVALGVAGSVGLVEHEHVRGLFNVTRTFHVPGSAKCEQANWPMDAAARSESCHQSSQSEFGRNLRHSSLRP